MANENGLEALAAMEYPGRVIIAGRLQSGEAGFVYGLTGRSPSSQARRLKRENRGDISIDVTDPKMLEQGDPALLVYNVSTLLGDILIISNGAQTDLIAEKAENLQYDGTIIPIGILLPSAFSRYYDMETRDGRLIDLTSYEPNFTPRISGVMRNDEAVLAVVKRDRDGSPLRCYYGIQLKPGQGKMIATYDGPNVGKGEVIPSFVGEPRDVMLPFGDPKKLVDAVYEALGKFRVSAAFIGWGTYSNQSSRKIEIINMHCFDK